MVGLYILFIYALPGGGGVMSGNSGGVEQMLNSREDGAAQNVRNGGILVIGNICRSKKVMTSSLYKQGLFFRRYLSNDDELMVVCGSCST